MWIDPTMLATMTGLIGATAAAIWSYLMASKVAAPRAKRLIVEALTHDGPEVKAVRAALIEPALEASYARIDAKTAEGATDIASDVESALNANLEAFSKEMSGIVYQAINQVKAQEAKALQAQLSELGLDEVVGEAKDLVAAQMPAQMLQAQRLLNMKVSKKYAAEHPIEAQAIEMGKLWVMQMLEGGMAGLPGMPSQRTTVEAPSGKGFGVR